MPDTRVVELFRIGKSQAVYLPDDFRFDGHQVFATRDPVTGDGVLSARPGASVWSRCSKLPASVEEVSGFMDERPMNVPAGDRHLFSDR